MKKSALIPMLRGALEQVVAQWVVHGDLDEVITDAQNVLAYTQTTWPDIAETYIPDEEMVLMYQGGLTTYEIAEKLGYNYGRVYAALKRNGVKFRSKGWNVSSLRKSKISERTQAMFAMRQQGATLDEIGTKFGVTRERVRQLLLNAGYHIDRPLRPEELKAVEDYANGGSLVEVARRNDTTPYKLRSWLAKAGVDIRPGPRVWRNHPKTLANAKLAAQMYRAGKTPAEIAEVIGCAPPSIYRLLAIAGAKPNRNAPARRKRIKRQAQKERRARVTQS